MKIHQQFDLNTSASNPEYLSEISKSVKSIPELFERLMKDLLQKGYIVIQEGVNSVGVPRRITLIKEFSGPFVTHFSMKAREDFKAISRALGIEKLFE